MRTGALAAVLTFLSAPGTALAAPTVTLELIVPDSTVPGETHEATLKYAIVGGDLSDVVISLDLPENVFLTDEVLPAAMTRHCQLTPGNAFDWSCTFTASSLEVPSGGLSGQIGLSLLFVPNLIAPGEELTIEASLAANWSNAGSAEPIAPVTIGKAVTALPGENKLAGDAILLGTNHTPSAELGFATVEGIEGMLVTMNVNVINQGVGYVHPGATATVVLPPGSRHVSHKLNANTSAPSPTAAWAAGDVSVTLDLVTKPAPSFSNDAAGVHLAGLGTGGAGVSYLLWMPCDALPTDDEGLGLTVTGSTQADGGGETTLVSAPLTQATSLPSGCGGPGLFNAGGAKTLGVGAKGGFTFVWFGPGVSDRFNATLSARIPAGAPTLDTVGTSVGWWSNKLDHGFALYRCTLPELEEPLTTAEFMAKKDDDCTVVDPAEPTDFSETSHVVVHATQWSADVDGVAIATDPVYLNLTFSAEDCTAEADTVHTFVGLASFQPTPGGAPETLTDSLDLTVQAGANLKIGHWGGGNGGAPTASPGQELSYTLAVGAGSTPIRNAIYTLQLPPAVTPVAITHNHIQGCTGALEHTFTLQPDGSFLVTYWAGVEGADVYTTDKCNPPTCAPAVHPAVLLTLRYDGAHPFLDGEVLTFAHAVDAANSALDGPALGQSTVTMQVPPEKRLTVEPVCNAAGMLGLRASATNSGGAPLTGLVLEMPIPKQDDGSGTEVNTTFSSWLVEGTASVTVECLQADTWVDGESCDASAASMRMTVAELGPYESIALTTFLGVPAGTAEGTLVRGTAELASNELLTISTQKSAPAKVGLCPGTLSIDGWMDVDGSGTREPGEAALAGWTVEVVDAALPELSVSIELPKDGKAMINLASGTYTVTVKNPLAGGEAIWLFSTPLPPSLEIVTDETTTLLLGSFCVCDDADACTADFCSAGECTHAFQSALGAGKADVCDGQDNDCDGTADNGCDDDEDGWCDSSIECFPGPACPNGCGDCNDEIGSAGINPGAAEICDGVDNNCDESTDEGCDDDGDGYCDAALGCGASVPALCSKGCDDCDDTKPGVNAGAIELCNGIDDTCDGVIDEDFALAEACQVGQGECVATGTQVCAPDGSGVICSGVPGEPSDELCNGKDDDCDGTPDNPTDCDGDLCTQGDVCTEAGCVAGAAKVCGDGAPCTLANCDPATAVCTYTPDPTCCTADADCPAPEEPCHVASCVDSACVAVPTCLALEACAFGSCLKACNPLKNPTECSESADTLFECKTDPVTGASGFVPSACEGAEFCALNGNLDKFVCCTPECTDRECGSPTECLVPCGTCDDGWACAGPHEPLDVLGTDPDAFTCVPGCSEAAVDLPEAERTWAVEVPECGPSLPGTVGQDTCAPCSGDAVCYQGQCKTACEELGLTAEGKCSGQVAQWCDAGTPKEVDCLSEGSYCCVDNTTEDPAAHVGCCSCASECALNAWECGNNSCGEPCGDPTTDDGCGTGYDCQARQCVCTNPGLCGDAEPAEDVSGGGDSRTTPVPDAGPQEEDDDRQTGGCEATGTGSNGPVSLCLAMLILLGLSRVGYGSRAARGAASNVKSDNTTSTSPPPTGGSPPMSQRFRRVGISPSAGTSGPE